MLHFAWTSWCSRFARRQKLRVRQHEPTVSLGPSHAQAADHHLVLEAERRTILPITVTSLASEITMLLLALAPYRGVVDAAGLAVPPASAGTANTWPG